MDALITRRGGGGNPLNFTVVGGTAQPESPKENTIWVNTDQEITDWAVSLTEPPSPAEGMVWIVTRISKNTELSVLKKKTLNIYPHNCYQYTNGEWVIKTAQTYRDGAWSPWVLYAYRRGDLCQDVSGGWTRIDGTVEYQAEAIYFAGAYQTSGKVRTIDTIDVTGFNSMVIIGRAVSTHSSTIAFQNCGLIPAGGSDLVAYWGINGTDTFFTHTVDISALQGLYTVQISTGIANGCKGYVYELYFV